MCFFLLNCLYTYIIYIQTYNLFYIFVNYFFCINPPLNKKMVNVFCLVTKKYIYLYNNNFIKLTHFMKTQIPQSLSYPVPPKFQYHDQNFYNTPIEMAKNFLLSSQSIPNTQLSVHPYLFL